MFTKKVQAVQWLDEYAKGDKRRQFCPVYVFHDGFASREEASEFLKHAGYRPASFVYVSFCGMWYPVHMYSYAYSITVTKDSTFIVPSAFAGAFELPSKKLKAVRWPAERRPTAGRKWTPGIVHDMFLMDKELSVLTVSGDTVTEAMFTNAVILVGIPAFATEICIKTDTYISHVLSHYYNQKSLRYLFQDDIAPARQDGIQYMNPFSKTSSRTKYEADKKLEKRIADAGLAKPEPIKQEDVYTERFLRPQLLRYTLHDTWRRA